MKLHKKCFASILQGTLIVFEESTCLFFQVELLGLELLTSAFGVLTCIRGLSAFLGPPFVIHATSPEEIVEVVGKFGR